ncbi:MULTISPECIES: hypothetical protein [unclassified Carboxylicivirga]|uniref:hypothetical protein n=1 Tax=Carboxylicivirga TaxID=1628153 RepID=UPI003D33DA7E
MIKSITLLLSLMLAWQNFAARAQQPNFQVEVLTCVESLVPSGTGRSRMIITNLDVDHQEFTSSRSKSKGSRNKANRQDIRIKNYEETKLLNLYNEGGIRFQNVASNDAIVTSKINDMLNKGWELFFVSTGVESKMATLSVKKELLKMGMKMMLDTKGGNSKNDPNGIFMTRYYFRKVTS